MRRQLLDTVLAPTSYFTGFILNDVLTWREDCSICFMFKRGKNAGENAEVTCIGNGDITGTGTITAM